MGKMRLSFIDSDLLHLYIKICPFTMEDQSSFFLWLISTNKSVKSTMYVIKSITTELCHSEYQKYITLNRSMTVIHSYANAHS